MNVRFKYCPPNKKNEFGGPPRGYLVIQHILGKGYCPMCYGELWSGEFQADWESDEYIDFLIKKLQSAKYRARRVFRKSRKQFEEEVQKRRKIVLPTQPISSYTHRT